MVCRYAGLSTVFWKPHATPAQSYTVHADYLVVNCSEYQSRITVLLPLSDLSSQLLFMRLPVLVILWRSGSVAAGTLPRSRQYIFVVNTHYNNVNVGRESTNNIISGESQVTWEKIRPLGHDWSAATQRQRLGMGVRMAL